MSKRAAERRESLRTRQLAAVERDRLPAWTPFERAFPTPLTLVQRVERVQAMREMAAANGRDLSEQDIQDLIDARLHSDEWWKNSRYTVVLNRMQDGRLVHLSIKRNDKAPPGPERWRDFQRIKDELVGPDCEGVELFPARERVVDTANQYHLWCINDPRYRFPFGFATGMTAGPEVGPMMGAVQRPFEEEREP